MTQNTKTHQQQLCTNIYDDRCMAYENMNTLIRHCSWVFGVPSHWLILEVPCIPPKKKEKEFFLNEANMKNLVGSNWIKLCSSGIHIPWRWNITIACRNQINSRHKRICPSTKCASQQFYNLGSKIGGGWIFLHLIS